MFRKKCKLLLVLSGCLLVSELLASTLPVSTISVNQYQPYLQFGGTRFFHSMESSAAGSVKLFMPCWQRNLSDLSFTELHVYDRSGASFEGNLHLGYRHLSADEERLFGFYGAFDRKKTGFGNYLNQVSFGGEYWLRAWFFGANIYQPIGKTTKAIASGNDNYDADLSTTRRTINYNFEKAAKGIDAEIGYEFINNLVGYLGGYYFTASDINTVCGPSARLTYDWTKERGRILGIFDKIGMEVGIRHDKPRGTIYYLSANAQLGWLFAPKTTLKGVSRHMVDSVRRDVDIITQVVTVTTPLKQQQLESPIVVSSSALPNDGGSGGGGSNNNETTSRALTDQDPQVTKPEPKTATYEVLSPTGPAQCSNSSLPLQTGPAPQCESKPTIIPSLPVLSPTGPVQCPNSSLPLRTGPAPQCPTWPDPSVVTQADMDNADKSYAMLYEKDMDSF